MTGDVVGDDEATSPPYGASNSKCNATGGVHKRLMGTNRKNVKRTTDAEVVEVVELRLDGELLAEAPLPGEVADLPAAADGPAVDDSIPGRTPAETPAEAPVEDGDPVEAARAEYQRLLSAGHKPADITTVTNVRGQVIEVRVGR